MAYTPARSTNAEEEAISSDPEILNRIAYFLSEHPGHAYCSDCLARRTHLDASVAWTAAVELGETADYEVDEGFCSYCLDEIEDVAHVQWVQPAEEASPDAPAKPRIRFTLRPPSEDEP